MNENARSGRRIIGFMYVVTVLVIGAFGYLVGIAIQPRLRELGVSHVGVGPFVLPMSPLNLAVIGMVMVGAGLAVLFALVMVASRFEN